MKSRGFKTSFDGNYPTEVLNLPERFFKDYEPTEDSLKLNRKRIQDRLNGIK